MKAFDPNDLRVLPPQAFSREREVRFHDIDAAGIMFYPRIFEYCNDLLVDYLASEGVGVPGVLAARRWAAPLRHVEADYFRPLRFGDRIQVALCRAQVKESAVTLAYRVGRQGEEGAVAVVQTTHVTIDPESFLRCPVPEELSRALQRFI